MPRPSIRRLCICIFSIVAVVWTAAVSAIQPPELTVYAKRLNTSGTLQRVNAGATLVTGDAISIRVLAVERAYVYVIAVGASGSAVLLQPFSEQPDEALMPAQMRRVIPGNDAVLPLDRHVGKETLIALAAPTPVRDPRAMLLEIESRAAGGGILDARAFADFGEVAVFAFRHAPGAEISSSNQAVRPVLFANSPSESGVLSGSGSRIRALLDGVPRRRDALVSVPAAPSVPATAVPRVMTPKRVAQPAEQGRAPQRSVTPADTTGRQPSVSQLQARQSRVPSPIVAARVEDKSSKSLANAGALDNVGRTSITEAASVPSVPDNPAFAVSREASDSARSSEGNETGSSWLSSLFGTATSSEGSTTSSLDATTAVNASTSADNASVERPARAQALNVAPLEQAPAFAMPAASPVSATDSALAVAPAKPALEPLALTPEQAVVEFDPSADNGASAAVMLVVTPAASGSALLIDDEGHLLTTWHLVKGFSRVTVWPKAFGQVLPDTATPLLARIVRVNRNSDLALLVIEGALPNVGPLELAEKATLKRGEVVHVLGHNNGDRWTHLVARHVRRKARHSWITHGRFVHRESVLSNQAVSAPDSTGGALFNDRMQLVGLTVQVGRKSGQLYAVAVDRIRQFLNGELAEDPSPSG
jgi:hypothetical protein